MKLAQLFEMAAKKICDKCGKTMAANHYWYKGGWRCKKGSTQDPVDASAQPQPTTTKVTPPSKVATSVPTVPNLKKMLPATEYDDPDNTIIWQVFEDGTGQVSVVWSYTFRRNTRIGAYYENEAAIDAANRHVQRIASMYPDYVKNTRLVTVASARKADDWAEGNNGSAYSEYEQSIGGGVTFSTSL